MVSCTVIMICKHLHYTLKPYFVSNFHYDSLLNSVRVEIKAGVGLFNIMTSLDTSHLSQTCCLGRSLQRKKQTKEEPLPVTSEGVWTFSVCLCFSAFLVYASFSFLCRSNYSLTCAFMSLCDIMHTHK